MRRAEAEAQAARIAEREREGFRDIGLNDAPNANGVINGFGNDNDIDVHADNNINVTGSLNPEVVEGAEVGQENFTNRLPSLPTRNLSDISDANDFRERFSHGLGFSPSDTLYSSLGNITLMRFDFNSSKA